MTAAVKPRACVACHARKVSCNASTSGIPCTRCIRRKQSASCVLVSRSNRRTSQRHVTAAANATDTATATANATSTAAGNATVPASNQPTPSAIGGGFPDQLHDHNQQQTLYHLLPGDIHVSPDQSSMVSEEDCHLRICQEMSGRVVDPLSPRQLGQTTGGREIIEYHGGVNPITILSEVLGKRQPKRLVRIIVQDSERPPDPSPDVAGLDRVDAEYLYKKGAFTVPSRSCCDALLRLYFERIHPHAPVLHRVHFMQEYQQGRYSPFLMQSILANVVPYASEALLLEAGYTDRAVAQKTFFLNAKRLYDFGCEKSQLRLLQGSIMLSSLSFSYAVDYDFRFWFNNAVRIATRMGLHRDNTIGNITSSDRMLLRRIWWVLYYRDVTLVISGHENLQRIHDSDFDTSPLQISDFDDETVEDGQRSSSVLPEFPLVQKLYLVQACRLSIIISQFLKNFRRPGLPLTSEDITQLETNLFRWRRGLPAEMHIDTIHDWSATNVWVLVLLGISFRYQSLFYRALREHYRTVNDMNGMQRAYQRQQNAMFELGTIIRRVTVHGLAQLCPLSLPICTSTLLAMRIEMALHPEVGPSQKLALTAQIHVELEHLRESSEFWTSLKWTLKMFEVVLARKGLSLAPKSIGDTAQDSDDDFLSNEDGDSASRSNDAAFDVFMGMPAQVSADINMFDDSEFLASHNTEEWLQDLLGCGSSGG